MFCLLNWRYFSHNGYVMKCVSFTFSCFKKHITEDSISLHKIFIICIVNFQRNMCKLLLTYFSANVVFWACNFLNLRKNREECWSYKHLHRSECIKRNAYLLFRNSWLVFLQVSQIRCPIDLPHGLCRLKKTLECLKHWFG